VGDDVVELAGDPFALVIGRLVADQLLLPLELRGLLGQPPGDPPEDVGMRIRATTFSCRWRRD
jgi:hypothetical protein